ncbi:MAG: hypothetical protein ABSH21_00770 [Verrucomicrobiia bacterium]|jgi:hypothetical protein
MPKPRRLQIIKRIQQERGTHLIAYVTSTRRGMEVQMAMDSLRKIYDHLKLIRAPKRKANIDLFLHSDGGDGTVPWRLVTLIREYAAKFSVLVPHRAFSAATLTALGADRILMHPMGMLGPTDPTVANQFNPRDPTNPTQPIGISVEDVTAYIALIKEDAGIQHEDQLVQAVAKLAEHVHPLALGNVKRSLSQSRMMAKKLLSLHMDSRQNEHEINEIVDNLTSKLFFHGHPINRREAKDQVGLRTIEDPSLRVEQLMWNLYLDYEREIRMEDPFQPAQEFVAQFPNQKPGDFAVTPVATAKLAFIESEKRTDVATIEYELAGHKGPDGITKVSTIHRHQGWTLE